MGHPEMDMQMLMYEMVDANIIAQRPGAIAPDDTEQEQMVYREQLISLGLRKENEHMRQELDKKRAEEDHRQAQELARQEQCDQLRRENDRLRALQRQQQQQRGAQRHNPRPQQLCKSCRERWGEARCRTCVTGESGKNIERKPGNRFGFADYM